MIQIHYKYGNNKNAYLIVCKSEKSFTSKTSCTSKKSCTKNFFPYQKSCTSKNELYLEKKIMQIKKYPPCPQCDSVPKPNGQLALLTLCDQALNPPFLGGKIIELGKFCFIKKKIERSFSFFIKPACVANSVWNFSHKFWNFAENIRDEKMHIFGRYLRWKISQFNKKI